MCFVVSKKTYHFFGNRLDYCVKLNGANAQKSNYQVCSFQLLLSSSLSFPLLLILEMLCPKVFSGAGVGVVEGFGVDVELLLAADSGPPF